MATREHNCLDELTTMGNQLCCRVCDMQPLIKEVLSKRGVTKEQALVEDEFHFGTCSKSVGPRGGIKISQTRVRRNGKTQTWKRSPERFRVPIKHGLYTHGEITEANANQFHSAKECPLES